MKSILVSVFLLANLLIMVTGATAQERDSCTNASLHGSFGLRATGRTLAGGDIVVLGRFVFDGNGNLTGRLFNRLPNATNETFTLTGTYSVTPECIVTDVWVPDNGSPATTHTSVIVDNGKGYYILNTTVGAPSVVSGEATRQ